MEEKYDEDIDPEKKTFLDEMMKARDRLGTGSKEELQWLFNFVHLDFSKISKGDWINLEYEFLAYIYRNGDGRIFPVFPFDKETGKIDKETDAIREDIERFQLIVREKLDHLVDKGRVHFKIESLTIILTPNSFRVMGQDGKYLLRMRKDKNLPWVTYSSTESEWSALQYNLSTLISEYAHLIRRCPECQKFFLAGRKNQLFCSIKHKGYVAVRKYRKSKGLITGRPRGRPRKNPLPDNKKGGF